MGVLDSSYRKRTWQAEDIICVEMKGISWTRRNTFLSFMWSVYALYNEMIHWRHTAMVALHSSINDIIQSIAYDIKKQQSRKQSLEDTHLGIAECRN